jgi:hypothetical protein
MACALSLALAAMIRNCVLLPVEFLSALAGDGVLVVRDVKCVIGQLVTVCRERRPASAPWRRFSVSRLDGMAQRRHGAR